jgi:pentatricopeptide repeat protein
MLYKGLKPGIVAYTILIRWCNIHGEFDEGLGNYSDMVKNGVQPNWDTKLNQDGKMQKAI